MLTLYVKITGPLVLESHILEEEKKKTTYQSNVCLSYKIYYFLLCDTALVLLKIIL